MIELRDVHKTYRMGDSEVAALAGVSLQIKPGEYVAIMGPSGSGKSTLLHILGLLDVPDSGEYRLGGHEIAQLLDDETAILRREMIGFIFQQFNLLPRLTALANTNLPLLYAPPSHTRLDMVPPKAEDLLQRVGLGARLHHHPNELSGGQQQRVAIARALMNNPRLLLADEPTGNLDSHSTAEILAILKELNDQGITVIMVTHEEEIGCAAKRLIRMRDGLICSDVQTANGATPRAASNTASEGPLAPAAFTLSSPQLNLLEHIHQGFAALVANKVRTFLSMLGILIGVAAVVAMLALGKGAQLAIEEQMATLGTNLLMMRPGALRMGGVALETGSVTRFTEEDVKVIKERIPAIASSAGAVMGRGQLTFGNKNWNTQVQWVGPEYAVLHAATPTAGRFFTEAENRKMSRVAVIGMTPVRELFGSKNPIGEIVKINKVSFQIIGILPERGAAGWRDQDDIILVPLQTAMRRLLGKDYVDYIEVQVQNLSEMEDTQEEIKQLMYSRHRVPLSQQQDAIDIRNLSDIKEALSQTSKTMSLLLATIATISLLVGGIGIMNIMLVSVTERTREVGLRKAIGARRRDIMVQFLAEAVVISVVGGALGVAVGALITQLMALLAGWTTAISSWAVILAFAFSATVGIIFGIYPARKASLLNPIEALRYE